MSDQESQSQIKRINIQKGRPMEYGLDATENYLHCRTADGRNLGCDICEDITLTGIQRTSDDQSSLAKEAMDMILNISQIYAYSAVHLGYGLPMNKLLDLGKRLKESLGTTNGN